MSDFSVIKFDSACALIPPPARLYSYRSNDLPGHETKTACINGGIQSDGLFVRLDGFWNPCLNGWIRLIAMFIPYELSPYEFSLRIEKGQAVEVVVGRDLPEGAQLANTSPNQWRTIDK